MDYLHTELITLRKALLFGWCGQIQRHYHHLLEAFYLIKGPGTDDDDDDEENKTIITSILIMC